MTPGIAQPILIGISVDTFDLKEWSPVSLEDVYFSLVIKVGMEGDVGSNLFYTTVASPEAIRARVGKGYPLPIISSRALIVVSEYDYDALLEAIEDIVNSAGRETAYDSSCVLNRYFKWEYEDFNPEEEGGDEEEDAEV